MKRRAIVIPAQPVAQEVPPVRVVAALEIHMRYRMRGMRASRPRRERSLRQRQRIVKPPYFVMRECVLPQERPVVAVARLQPGQHPVQLIREVLHARAAAAQHIQPVGHPQQQGVAREFVQMLQYQPQRLRPLPADEQRDGVRVLPLAPRGALGELLPSRRARLGVRRRRPKHLHQRQARISKREPLVRLYRLLKPLFGPIALLQQQVNPLRIMLRRLDRVRGQRQPIAVAYHSCGSHNSLPPV